MPEKTNPEHPSNYQSVWDVLTEDERRIFFGSGPANEAERQYMRDHGEEVVERISKVISTWGSPSQ